MRRGNDARMSLRFAGFCRRWRRVLVILWRSRVSRQLGCRKIRSKPSADLPGGDHLGKFIPGAHNAGGPCALQNRNFSQKFLLFGLFTNFYRLLGGVNLLRRRAYRTSNFQLASPTLPCQLSERPANCILEHM